MTRPLLAAAWLLLCATQAAAQPAREDERRPEQPLAVQLGDTAVQLGGSWEASDDRRRNFDLDRSRARDRRVREHELKLEARARPAPGHEWFVQAVGLRESRRTQGTPQVQYSRSLERGEMWWRVDSPGGIAPLSLQLGRQALVERRAWWWDDDLDALRLRWRGSGWALDTGLARELLRVSSADRGVRPQARGVTRWFGHARHEGAERQLWEAFWLWQHDGSGRGADVAAQAADPSDISARWAGLRYSDQWRGAGDWRLAWRADLAWLRGRETLARSAAPQALRGHALDLGAQLTLPLPLRPVLSLGWARGSAGFRQTGLHENKGRLGGVKRTPLYGLLLRPELANLQLASAGAGLRFMSNSSLELLAWHYRQVQAAATLAGTRLSATPGGLQRSLGHEVDVVLALREWRHVELVLAWGRFTPGPAFAADRRDSAQALDLTLNFNF